MDSWIQKRITRNKSYETIRAIVDICNFISSRLIFVVIMHGIIFNFDKNVQLLSVFEIF